MDKYIKLGLVFVFIVTLIISCYLLLLTDKKRNGEDNSDDYLEFPICKNEKDLDNYIDEDIVLYANLYNDKQPILQLNNTIIYCFKSNESDNEKLSALDIVNEYNISIGTDNNISVIVWGKLTIQGNSTFSNDTVKSQLIDGYYKILYWKIEVNLTEFVK